MWARNGTRLLTASVDEAVRVWDMTTHKRIHLQTLIGLHTGCRICPLSEDGRLFLVGDNPLTHYIVEVSENNCYTQRTSYQRGNGRVLAVSPTGSIAYDSADQVIIVHVDPGPKESQSTPVNIVATPVSAGEYLRFHARPGLPMLC